MRKLFLFFPSLSSASPPSVLSGRLTPSSDDRRSLLFSLFPLPGLCLPPSTTSSGGFARHPLPWQRPWSSGLSDSRIHPQAPAQLGGDGAQEKEAAGQSLSQGGAYQAGADYGGTSPTLMWEGDLCVHRHRSPLSSWIQDLPPSRCGALGHGWALKGPHYVGAYRGLWHCWHKK